jgi:hypothetical protein
MKTIKEIKRKYEALMCKAATSFEYQLLKAEYHHKLKLLFLGENLDYGLNANEASCDGCGS